MKDKTGVMIPISHVIIYQDETDDTPVVVHGPFDLWKMITTLQHDYRSRIELRFSEVDSAFIITVTWNSFSIKDAYLAGIERGKEIVFRRSNRIGFVQEDEETGLLSYGV